MSVLFSACRVDPVGQSPRMLMYGSFPHGTVPPQHLYSSRLLSLPSNLRRSPSPIHSRLPLSRSPGFRLAFGTIRPSDDSLRVTSHFAFPLIGSLTTAPPVDPASPPGVTY